ncbi:MAG: DUF5693 family protein [Bacillota bacterium]|nr:DUF5693 family protein [Bacillota bacterium]HHU60859.1 hypothetical protein [Natronincola sp.]
MKKTLWIIVLLAAIVSGVVAFGRWQVERNNKTVEIVFDLASLVELSKNTGVDLHYYLAELAKTKVVTIAIEPENLGQQFLKGQDLSKEVRDKLPKEVSDLEDFLLYPVTFSQNEIASVRQAGFNIAPKLIAAPWKVEEVWRVAQPDLVLISGKESPDLDLLKEYGARVGLVEFSTPSNMPLDLGLEYIRVHGISAPEMRVLSVERILERYLRAARERNIRVLYVRSFVEDETSWHRSTELLSDLQQRLHNAGFSLGKAKGYPPWYASLLLTTITTSGIWAGATLLFMEIWPNKSKFFGWFGVFFYLLSIVGLLINPSLMKTILAFITAIIFPCLAVLQGMQKNTAPLKSYLFVALISFLGALFVVSTLNGTAYLLKIQEFRGVKLMHILPIILMIFILARPLKPWLKKDVPVIYLIGGVAIGALGLIYIARTGNFGLPVPAWELKIRAFLERLFVIRPRTKEVLVGYPALYFALQARNRGKSLWLPVAVIGPISLVNTFTHTHTPLAVSLLRSAYGLVLGYIAGRLAFRIFSLGKRWLQGDRCKWLLRIRQSWR